jgi:arylsulfatase A-like enzyme
VPNLASPAVYRPAADGAGKAGTVGRTNEAHLDYLRHVTGADENLGRLLRTLDDLGLSDDTVVVYASDNGFYLGEHGLGDKRSLYEESLRIPLLVRYPRLVPKGATIDEMVLNIDLAPTLLELAGVPVPREIQGMSWVPLLTGRKPAWRQSFLVEYFYEANFNPPTMLGVRTTNAKLIEYPGHPEWTEVFDLAADSYETKNLAKDAARQSLLAAELAAQVKSTGYHVPAHADKPGDGAEKTDQKKKKAKKQ